MIGCRKISLKKIFNASATLALLFFLTWKSSANYIPQTDIYSTLTSDTIPQRLPIADTLTNPTGIPKSPSALPQQRPTVIRDTTPLQIDTKRVQKDSTILRTDTFSLRLSKDALDAPVEYSAEDSGVILAVDKKIILYGKTETVYTDITLTAPKVELDQRTNILTAVHDLDSSGLVGTRARFAQAENQFESDTIQFNFKTQKGFTKNTFTQDGEMFVQGETIKKINSSTFFVSSARFTTCNYDEPHFAFKANKMKVINNKVAVTGPVHPEFEGVPVPLYLPFGYYPLSKGRHSGLLQTTFTVTEDRGIGLEGFGYYHVINDYIDVTLRGNLYSYGSWSANITPSYRRLYRYAGAFNFGLQHTKFNFKGDPDFNKAKTFALSWNHSVDQKARPGTNFGANVNVQSSKYNRLIANDPRRNFQNQLSSSIAYSKSWIGKPYNLTLSANHDQNNATRLMNVRLPDAGFSVTTLYPFERKEAIGTPKWYEKVGIGYSGAFKNQFSFYDTAFDIKRVLDTLQWGASHQIPINLPLPPLGPFIVSPSIGYQEQWIMRKYDLEWNPALKKVDTTNQTGFYTARQITTGIGFNTALYGTVLFKNSRIIAMRHTVRPNFGFSYTPNMAGKYWDKVQFDTTGRVLEYSQFSGNLFTGGFNNRRFGGINFGVDNNLEIKVRSRKDTGVAAIKKIRLIDGFSINSGYNFLEDSFQLNDFTASLRSTLFDKINLNMNANLSPYQVDAFGRRINRYQWKGDGFKPGMLTNFGISLSTQFRSKPRDPEKKPELRQTSTAITDPALLADQQRLTDYMRRNPSEFVDFNIPWDIGLDFSLNLNRQLKADFSGFENIVYSNLNFRSSFSLTPKWNFSTNGYFDMKTQKLQTFTMSINREMHCWQLFVNVTPVGQYSYFNISISPKSSMLQDLRVNRTRTFSNF